MRILIRKRVGGSQWVYPDNLLLFPNGEEHPTDEGLLICENHSGKTAAELSVGFDYTIQEYVEHFVPSGIKFITVRALKQRLTMEERHAVRHTDDLYIEDIYDDVVSSSYIDLESPDLAAGLEYVLAHLTSVQKVGGVNGVKTVEDVPARLLAILADGTESEKYNGFM